MAMPEFQQLCNEAKKEIQEIDVAELKRMQQAGEDLRSLMCANERSRPGA